MRNDIGGVKNQKKKRRKIEKIIKLQNDKQIEKIKSEYNKNEIIIKKINNNE